MTIFQNSILVRNPNFRIFFLADFFGKVADSYFLLLLPFLFYEFTESGVVIGIALALNGVFRGVLSLYGGVLADRYPPQKILTLHNFLQAVSLLGLFLFMRGNMLSTAVIYLVSSWFGILDGFAAPASQSATPKIVANKDLLEANSYTQGLEQLTAIIGPVVAGLIIARINLIAGVLGGVLLYTVSTLFFARIFNFPLVSQKTLNKSTQFIPQIKEGIVALRKNKVVQTSLWLLVINNFFITGFAVVGLLILSRTKFGLGADTYAISGILFSLGFILGIPLVSKINKRFNFSKILLCIYIVYGVSIALIGIVPNFYWVMLLYFVVGPAVAMDITLTTTWQQEAVPKHLLGRIGSLSAITALALDPLSQALTGILTDWSIEGTFVLTGVGITTSFLILYALSPTLRKDSVI